MKRILLLIAPVVLLVLAFRPVNSHSVTGTVTDEKGSPIQNVSVRVKGMVTGTSTKSDGTFIIVMSRSTGTLIFSAVNYETKEVKINGEATISVTLGTASPNNCRR
jgi:Ca-activated chloride channel family protein